MVSQTAWLGELLSEQRFTSVLQPIVFANMPGKVFAHEALLRGVGNNDAIVYPKHLFDVARGCGMLVQLDDVGAGYSSLNLLDQLRPDFVKLDMDLIRGADTNLYKALIAQKIIEIANALFIETIAEGVETPAERRGSRDTGPCTHRDSALGGPACRH